MKVIALMIFFLFSSTSPVVSFEKDGAQLLGLLKARDFEKLEFATKQVQEKFENGELSEIELRNTYRPFYNLDKETLDNVEKWKSKFPTSYAAHLIRGTYFKKKGLEARGKKYISDTPQENIKKMRQYFEIAKIELNASLKLTHKPFLSIFHLLDISQHEGDDETSLALLTYANEMLPSNTLVRNRFIQGLEPRWGGSYEQMKDFIKKSKAEGISTVGIRQLMAITYDDMGFALVEHGDTRAAIENFSKALELGQRVGGEFRKDFLSHSCYYSCREPALKKYCQ